MVVFIEPDDPPLTNAFLSEQPRKRSVRRHRAPSL
jgi:hypothetical protein